MANHTKTWTREETIRYYFEQIAQYPRGETRSKKYTAYVRPSGGYYFVGRKGAIRAGKTLSESISLTDMVLPRIVKEVEQY